MAFFTVQPAKTVTVTSPNYQNHLFPTGHQDTHLLQHLIVSSFNQRLWSWKDGERNHSMGLPHSPKTNRHHLLKDNLGRYCHIIFEMAKEKKGGDARNWTQGLWLKLPALYLWATTPTNNHLSFFPLFLCSCMTIDEIMCWLLRAIADHERMVSIITAWRVQWTGLPQSEDQWRSSNQR